MLDTIVEVEGLLGRQPSGQDTSRQGNVGVLTSVR